MEGVTDDVLAAVATQRLQVLHVPRCRNITDRGVATVAETAAEALTDINLAETPVTCTTVGVLAVHCTQVHTLCLRQCKRLQSAGGLVLIARNGHLRNLNVGVLDIVSNELLLELASSCSRTLESLTLNFCRNVSPLAVGTALDACTELAVLNVFGCSQLSKASLRGHRNDRVVVHGEPSFEEGSGASAVTVAPVAAVDRDDEFEADPNDYRQAFFY